MSKMKKRILAVAVLAMMMSFIFVTPAFAEDQFTVHAKVDSSWATPGLWAWKDSTQKNVFSAWPGQTMTADDKNTGWFTYSIPTWADCIIINDNGVGKQTANLPVDAKELWVTVGADGSADVVYEAPADFATADAAAAVTDDTATATTADVPKTGVADLGYVFMSLAGLSGAGYMVVKRKKAA